MNSGDFGPIYTETDLSRFPVEPWNTCSNIIFLAIVLYFWLRVRSSPAPHALIRVSLPILAVGFFGGTVYHATRSHNIWLILDFVPILLLTTLASVYFWLQIYEKKLPATLTFVAVLVIAVAVRQIVPGSRQVSISLGYTSLAVGLVLPIVLYSRRKQWRHSLLVVSSFAAFVIAITFRLLDRDLVAIFPMGTHFLWHLFGGLSTFFMLLYVYREDLSSLKEKSVPGLTEI